MAAAAQPRRGQRGLAALAYLPLPGLGFALGAAGKGDRLARMHGAQGGVLGLLVYPALLVVAVLKGPTQDAAAFTVGGAWLAYAIVGVSAAARGRFTRLRGPWDIAGLGYVVRMRGS